MILEFLVSLGAGSVAWIATLFPTVVLPEWVSTSSASVYGFLDSASGLGVWVPWAAISVVFGGLLTFYLVMFGVSVFFKAAKHIPLVGGGG